MGSFGSFFTDIIGTYSPSGDYFGGADWGYIFRAIVLCIFIYWSLKYISYLFHK